jgi:hypothetical protein
VDDGRRDDEIPVVVVRDVDPGDAAGSGRGPRLVQHHPRTQRVLDGAGFGLVGGHAECRHDRSV